MLSRKSLKKAAFVGVLVSLAIFTRFLKLNWGDGFFFNPDENNMANAITHISFSDLNPHFFAYGQFPLFLTFFSIQLFHLITDLSFIPSINMSEAILGLRFWSAVFSLTSLLVLYLISKNLIKDKKFGLIFLLFLIFNPGMIQLSHFGTTESILIFVFVSNILISQKLVSPKASSKIIFWAGLVSGIGLATKISALILMAPILFAFLFKLIKNRKIIKTIFMSLVFLALTIIFGLLLSPYNLISKQEFLGSMNYEIPVATGKLHVFYTSQFLHATPYIFQFKNIFPYVSGIFVYILFFFGLILLAINKKCLNLKWSLIYLPALIYFLYNGQLYTKWTRFMSPLFFIFPLFAAYFVSNVKNKYIVLALVLISVIPGILFLNIYMNPDIRIQASDWINSNIPQKSFILSESGNVINMPVFGNYYVDNFDFYQLDSRQDNLKSLADTLKMSDYIFVPSRRVFKNQNNPEFPVSQKYYENLFSGDLGFKLIKEFSPQTDLFLNSENAEETWSVFDRPTVRIFQKNNDQSNIDYQQILTN
jgi:hypothetical protein